MPSRWNSNPVNGYRGWSTAQVAKRFQVTVQTIINWVRGVDNDETTVQMPERPNRYPDFVRYIVQQLKSFCPMLGRYKIADIPARAGLHLSASTVKRIVDEPPIEPTNDVEPTSPSVTVYFHIPNFPSLQKSRI